MKTTDAMVGPFDREMRRFAEDYEALRRQYFDLLGQFLPGIDRATLSTFKAKEQALCTIYGVTLQQYDGWQRASLRTLQAARRRLGRWKN